MVKPIDITHTVIVPKPQPLQEKIDVGMEDQEYLQNNIRIIIMKYLKKLKKVLRTSLKPITQMRNLVSALIFKLKQK